VPWWPNLGGGFGLIPGVVKFLIPCYNYHDG